MLGFYVTYHPMAWHGHEPAVNDSHIQSVFATEEEAIKALSVWKMDDGFAVWTIPLPDDFFKMSREDKQDVIDLEIGSLEIAAVYFGGQWLRPEKKE
jgi:hypothetical protein